MSFEGVFKWRNYFVGIGAGIVFLILNSLIPLIGFNAIPVFAINYQLVAQFLLVVGIAPIVEEVLFTYIFYNVLEKKLSSSIGAVAAIMVSAVIVAIAFSAYHYSAYGAGLVAAFVGAFAFRIFAVGIYEWRKDLIVPIAAHQFFNFVFWATTALTIAVI